MYRQYLVDESEVNKRNVTEFGYDNYSPYRVVERTVQGKDERLMIVVSYIGKGAKSAAAQHCKRLNAELQ